MTNKEIIHSYSFKPGFEWLSKISESQARDIELLMVEARLEQLKKANDILLVQ